MIWTCPKDNKHKRFQVADIVTYEEKDIINPRGETLGASDPWEIERDDSGDCVCLTCGSIAIWANPMPEKVDM